MKYKETLRSSLGGFVCTGANPKLYKKPAQNEGNMDKKFKERYLLGEIEFEEIDEYINNWNESEEPCSLREYLGLNSEEEELWIDESEEALRELLDSQVNGR